MSWYDLLCGACGILTTFIALSAFIILSELRKYLVI